MAALPRFIEGGQELSRCLGLLCRNVVDVARGDSDVGVAPGEVVASAQRGPGALELEARDDGGSAPPFSSEWGGDFDEVECELAECLLARHDGQARVAGVLNYEEVLLVWPKGQACCFL